MISLSSSFKRWINNSVKRELFKSLYPPFNVMRKYVLARGSLKVLSSLNQNFINGSSSIHLGCDISAVEQSLDALLARIEKSQGINSFLAGKCKKLSICGGSLHNSNRDWEISSSIYRDPNHGSNWKSENSQIYY